MYGNHDAVRQESLEWDGHGEFGRRSSGLEAIESVVCFAAVESSCRVSQGSSSALEPRCLACSLRRSGWILVMVHLSCRSQ
jgi:hypothetical protein